MATFSNTPNTYQPFKYTIAMTPKEYALQTGNLYTTYKKFVAVPKDSYRDIYIEIDDIPDTKAWWITGFIESDDNIRTEIYAQSTVSNKGTQLSLLNRNANYIPLLPTDDIRMYHTPTVTNVGILFRENLIVTGAKAGAFFSPDKFLYKLKNDAGIFRIYNISTVGNATIIITIDVYRYEEY